MSNIPSKGGIDIMKKIILIIVFLCFSVVGYAEEYKGEVVNVWSVNATVLSGELHVSKGEGKYEGYKKLNGYPGQDVFQVYFKDGARHEIDILNIDLNERIEWEYKGITYNHSRQEIYKLFAEMQSLRSVNIKDTWQYQTFGQVYCDWLKQTTYDQDATRLIAAYQMFERGERPYDRFALANVKIDFSRNTDEDIDGIK